MLVVVVMVVSVTEVAVVVVPVLVLEVVVVATQSENVLSWYRSIASFRYPTALHDSLKSLISPEPLQPNTSSSPETTPLVSRDTIVFSTADAARHVPAAACKT